MNTNIWAEPGGPILKEALRQEARVLRQLHQPPGSLDRWLEMRRRLRRRLLKAAGTFPEPVELNVREHGLLKMDGYRIAKITYQSRRNLRVTANLYLPDGPGPFAGVLNVHGHWVQGKIGAGVADRCHILAREGFVVLCVDAIGAGERGTKPGEFEYHGSQQGVSLLSVGETLLGMQVYDNMRGIDLLQSLACVDKQRIGVTGASGGGNQTMWVAALDPRVKAAVPVVSVGTFESYVTNNNCWCETLPGGLQSCEEWGVLGLIAPNPLLILTALKEGIPAFFLQEMLRSYAQARRVYGLYGAEEKIAYQAVNRPHGYCPEMQRCMLGWFKHWLQGEGSALPRALPKVPELPETTLMCFPGKSRPPQVKSLLAYASLRTRECKQSFLAQSRLDRVQKVRELRRMIKLPGGPEMLRRSEPVCGEEGGMRFEKITVEVEPNMLVPCMLLWSGKKTPLELTIALHPHGKERCLKEPFVQALLKSGRGLCLVDLRHTGETKWDMADSTEHLPPARTAMWLGRTMIGDWVKDILAVRAALMTRRGAKRVELLAFEEPALAALAAAAIGKHFAGVSVVNLLSSYVVSDIAPVQRYSIFVPGILQWGDVTLLAGLAHCSVRVCSLVHPSGRALSRKERSAWLGEVRQFGRRMGMRCKAKLKEEIG